MIRLIIALMLVFSTQTMIYAQSLEDIIAARSDETKQRDSHRNPQQTLEFFKISPKMSVAEALPGGGWYTRIIAPYLGSEGQLYGINYNDDMWARFGFFDEAGIARQIALTQGFPAKVKEFSSSPPKSSGFTFETVPETLHGNLDRILFIRALHNLNRFESEAGTMTEALTAAFNLLKDGGMVGVVQHRAPEGSPDEWADGSNGYLKQSHVINEFKKAGFKLVGSSEINANSKDMPTPSDMVWRLPPTYFGTDGDETKVTAANDIGESDRMTLLFRK